MISVLRALRNESWLGFVREALRHDPVSAPSILLKAAVARVRWRFEPRRTVMSGLHRRPISAGRDYLKYKGELESGLQLINWQNGGHRLIEDKVITAERFVETGIATAPIIAVIGRDQDLHPHGGVFPVLQTCAQVADALRAAPDEIFVKPAGGDRGKDVMGPTRMRDAWQVGDESLSSDELAARLVADKRPLGLLLQPRLRTHRAMAPVGGELGLSTVRINTALAKTGPKIMFAFLKIMGSKGLVDNFHGGKYGNMLAALDIATGRIVRVYGRRPGQTMLMSELTTHPVTGADLIGYEVPMWPETIAFAARAASACPESPLLGADVAITDDGPMIVEINADWDANVPQLLTGRGLRAILREVWPDLAVADDVKAQAAAIMRL